MPFGENTLVGSLTPGRRTRIILDPADTQMLQPPWAETRFGKEMTPTIHPLLGASYSVQTMQTGLIGLRPLNAEIHYQHETTAGEAAIMSLAEFNTVAGTVARAVYYSAAALSGIGGLIGVGVKAVGDYFLSIDHQAGGSWDKSLTTGLVQPPVPEPERFGSDPNVALNRVAEGRTTHAEDTGYLLRWYVPGNPFDRTDLVFRFYFGGPVSPAGHGQFCLTLGGSGSAYLHEFISGTWTSRAGWRFCNPQDAINVQHFMRIIPYAEAFIEFQSQIASSTQPPSQLLARPAITRDAAVSDQTSFTYEIPASVIAARDPGNRRFVTGQGQPRWDMRADTRPMFQVARLVYPVTTPGGVLIDGSVQAPWAFGAATLGLEQPVEIGIQWLAGPDISAHAVTIALYDDATGNELPPDASGQGYTLLGGTNGIIPVVNLATTDPYHSPYVRSYSIHRPPVVQAIAPGETWSDSWQTSVAGTGTDPSTESASFLIQDTEAALSMLRNRGGIPIEARVVLNEAEEVSVFRGYVSYSGGWLQPHAEHGWPDPDWHGYEIEAHGMWERLARALFSPKIIHFGSEESLPAFLGGPGPAGNPWKVSDIVRYCLAMAGFTLDRIDVPDNPMRVWASAEKETSSAAWLPTPGGPIGPYVVKTAYDYLGARLLWDPSAGTNGGMWRLRLQPRAGATPLYAFTDDPQPQEAGPILPHVKEAYPAATWVILKEGTRSSLIEWTEPAENSAVFVIASLDGGYGVQAWAINTDMVDVPGWGTTADPSSPDYRDGGFYPLLDVLDYVPPGDAGRRYCMWRCRRLFDQACRAHRFKRFAAPVDYVTDPSDALLFGRKRPLRYGDTILVNGVECFVTSYSMMWRKDNAQVASVEAQEFNAPLEVVL